MPRGYRYAILALVGWLTLTGQHPSPETKGKEAAAQRTIADRLPNIATTYHKQAERAKRPPERQPCGPHHYKSSDDLCAQWKAADAAVDSAKWAAFSGWFGGLSFLGVLAAISLAYHSNWIARDTAKRQLRAYISVEPQGIFDYGEENRLCVLVKNGGQTPAYDIVASSFVGLIEGPRDFKPTPDEISLERIDAGIMLGPQESMSIWVGLNPIPQDSLEAIRDKKLAIGHYGSVVYRDAFRTSQTTYFAHYHWGEEMSDAEARRSRYGNDAT